jgi:DNA-binding MarR family transcriptional regulator
LNGRVITEPEDPPTAAPASLLYVVKQIELATRAQLEALLKPSGVTALQYTALSVLERRPTMTSADLARASFVRAQSTADLVGALERRGLIRRTTDAENRRRLLISLTPEGRHFLAEYAPRVAALEQRMLRHLDQPARENFREYLYACREGISEPA